MPDKVKNKKKNVNYHGDLEEFTTKGFSPLLYKCDYVVSLAKQHLADYIFQIWYHLSHVVFYNITTPYHHEEVEFVSDEDRLYQF